MEEEEEEEGGGGGVGGMLGWLPRLFFFSFSCTPVSISLVDMCLAEAVLLHTHTQR
jgi:hypothetical protein